jgi:hypothetical protein
VQDPVRADEVAHGAVRKQLGRLGGVGDGEAVLADAHGSRTSQCSAIRGAITVRSYASCAFSANSCTTPESRISIESEWPPWMLIGPDRARASPTSRPHLRRPPSFSSARPRRPSGALRRAGSDTSRSGPGGAETRTGRGGSGPDRARRRHRPGRAPAARLDEEGHVRPPPLLAKLQVELTSQAIAARLCKRKNAILLLTRVAHRPGIERGGRSSGQAVHVLSPRWMVTRHVVCVHVLRTPVQPRRGQDEDRACSAQARHQQ